MLCPACKNFRPANNTPCPQCNAPAPMVGGNVNQSNASFAASWNNQNQTNFGGSNAGGSWGNQSQANWGNSSPNFGSSINLGSTATLKNTGALGNSGPWQNSPEPPVPFQQSPIGNGGSRWAQVMGQSSPNGQQGLVPYQGGSGGQGAQSNSLAVMQQAFPVLNPNVPQVNSLIPSVEAPIYVAPMFTKPRPIIPPYRAISGLLSVIIVFGALCSFAGYFAQTTGKLTPLEKLLGLYSPAKITNSQSSSMLTVPSTYPTAGPADASIPSAALASKVDPNSGLVLDNINSFTVSQPIYLVCTVATADKGTLDVKWYMGNSFFTPGHDLIDPATNKLTAYFKIQYAFATEGKVEIYWNGKLAKTLLFVVQPKA